MAKTRSVDLSAQLLGLERTLEDDILDLMESYVKDSVDNTIDDFVKDIRSNGDKSKLDEYIRKIVYDVLREVLGETFVRGGSSKSFKDQLFWILETNGFERNCKGCYYQVKNYGKIEHGKL